MDGVDGAAWRTASYSGNSGNCVEVADAARVVLVRDTKERSGPVLSIPTAAWAAFTDGLRTD